MPTSGLHYGLGMQCHDGQRHAGSASSSTIMTSGVTPHSHSKSTIQSAQDKGMWSPYGRSRDSPVSALPHMGGCQNSGPFFSYPKYWVPYYKTTTHMSCCAFETQAASSFSAGLCLWHLLNSCSHSSELLRIIPMDHGISQVSSQFSMFHSF